MALTKDQRERIAMMRRAGVAYTDIANHVDSNANTVKTWCRRAGITPDPNIQRVEDPVGQWCLECGARIESARKAKFCTSTCRRSWWHAHPERLNRKAIYTFTCHHCGTRFSAYGNRKRKYCTHACYIRDRFGTRGGRS